MSSPTIQRRPRTQAAKVVVTGPFDAGKTTLITTICSSTVLTTERGVSGTGEDHSGRTTVAMDYGRIPIAEDLALALFGTPGQDRFGFMWDILAEGMVGYVLVLDASRPDSFTEARSIRRHFEHAADVPSVVVVNKAQEDADRAVRRASEALELPPDITVLAADVRRREDVKRVLVTLLRAAHARAADLATPRTSDGDAG